MSERRNPEAPKAEQLTAWRRDAQREVERIGSAELAARLKVPHGDMLDFLGGKSPSGSLQVALSVYDFVDYPDLKHLMAAYFHDSYDALTGSPANWQAAVDDFVQSSPRGLVLGAAADIRRFLQATPNERVWADLVRLGSCFGIKAVPLTPREWIQAVHDRLMKAVEV